MMTRTVTSLPTASGELPGGNASATAGAFYTNTVDGRAAHPVSAGGGSSISRPPARLIRGAATLLFAALLTFGMGHTATKAVANLAHDMHPKGW